MGKSGGTGKGAGTAVVAGTKPAKVKVFADPQKWSGTKEQKEFLEKVLKSHIKRSTKRKGKALSDLDKSDLAKVKGTSKSMKKKAAEFAGKLLDAATKDLKTAQKTGDADAKKTVKLTATSGYRDLAFQDRIWRTNFKGKYYDRKAAEHTKLSGGQHGDSAVQKMAKYVAKWVAAPGFSNHQAGLAIDFYQNRTKGNKIANSTKTVTKKRKGKTVKVQVEMEKWRKSWFFKWLRKNAGTYHFEEYSGEAWHWTYNGSDK